MAKGISIGVAADTREFTQGVNRGVINPLEDAVDSLDDVQRAGDKAGEQLEAGFEQAQDAVSDFKREQQRTWKELRDGTIDSRQATERLETAFKDLSKTATRETRDAGDDIGRNVRRGTDDAKEGVEEIGRESASTAKEAAASFDGSAESIADAFQEVAANAFAGFGPAGLIAGVAAAAGIGVVLTKLQEGTEQSERFKARVGELTTELLEAGTEGGPSLEYLVDQIKTLAAETDDAETSLEDLRKVADQAGRPFEDLAKAYAGNADGLDELLKKNRELYDSLNDQAGAIDTTTNAGVKAFSEIQYRIKAQEQYNQYLADASSAADAAAQSEKNYVAAGGPELERKAALIANVDQAYDDAAGAATDYVNAETGLFDTGAYIAAMQAKEKALRDYQTTLETSALSPEAKSFLDGQGQEAAATFLAGYAAATPAQQRELNRIWSAGGSTASGAFTGALKAGIPGTIPGPRVMVEADTTNYDRTILNLKGQKQQAFIDLITVPRAGTKAP